MVTARPRTLARVAAIQALYQSEQINESAETVIDQFIRHRLIKPPHPPASTIATRIDEGLSPDANAALFATIVRRAIAEQDQIDPLIAANLPESWPMPRLDPVLRALLRAASAELRMSDGPPARVVINEYLDIAHGFFAEDAVQLANAMLDRIAHTLRPADFPAKVSADLPPVSPPKSPPESPPDPSANPGS